MDNQFDEKFIVEEENEFVKMTKTSEMQAKVVLVAKIAISLLVAVLSFTCFSNVASSPTFHKNTIEMLDQKKITVMELSGGAALAATSASLVLGDRAQPIATKLMDLTGYFVIILCAIILEKYLVTILGLASFKIILPIAALLYLFNVFLKNESLKKVSIKLAVFSIAIFLVIPMSVGISNLIEKTYSNDVQVLIDSTKEIKEEVDKIQKEEDISNQVEEIVPQIEEYDDSDGSDIGLSEKIANLFGGVIKSTSNFVSGAKQTVSNIVGSVGEKAKEILTKTTKILSDMIEKVAIMLVTTCIIPILVLFFFIWIIKMFFGLDIKAKNIETPKIIQPKDRIVYK